MPHEGFEFTKIKNKNISRLMLINSRGILVNVQIDSLILE